MIGRAYLWGMAAGGEKGVANVLQILRSGIDEALLGLGRASVHDLVPRGPDRPAGLHPRPEVARSTRPVESGPEMSDVMAEARRRRTFAVISHPDAGKSTLTEALALYAERIDSAGAVHGKAGRRGVTSDWMEMERKRGISITSAVLQFGYRDCVINLLDTPGHGDFSEDTYRVLAAVDAAVMLLDAAKGLEPQTLKLFDVCRSRGHPGAHLRQQVGPARPGGPGAARRGRADDRAAPDAGDLAGRRGRRAARAGRVRDRRVHPVHPHRGRGDPGRAPRWCRPTEIAAAEPEFWPAAQDELALLREIGADFDEKDFLRGVATPVLFGAALTGIGVQRLLDALVELAPAPEARDDADGRPRDLDAPLSGLVFKVQAGMDRSHRDRMAFVRICSGRFERGMVLTHAATGRPFATKYAQAVFGQQRTTVEEAFPGDIVGLVNAGALRPGDTLYAADAGGVPGHPELRPGALRGGPRGRRRHVQAVPQGHRAARQRGRDPGADLGPARRPGAGAGRGRARCSSRWSTDRLENEFRAPVHAGAAGLLSRPAHRRRRARPRWPGRARSRCCAGAPTARCSPCSAPSGGWRRCAASCPTSPSTRCRRAPPTADTGRR